MNTFSPPNRANCVVCGTTLDEAHRYLYFGACPHWSCRAVVIEKLRIENKIAAKHEQAHHEARRQLARSARDAACATEAGDQYSNLPFFPVPANTRPFVPLPADRRQEFQRLLQQLIDIAFATDAATDAAQLEADPTYESAYCAAPLPILGHACGVCGGACCLGGGNEAHLTVATIQRYRRQHPGAEPADVRQAYEARLSEETYQDSCIFHGARGCNLPRALRADVCNSFSCRELSEIEAGVSRAHPWAFIVAIDEAQQIVRT